VRKSKSGIVIAFVYLFLLCFVSLVPDGAAQTRRTSGAGSRIPAAIRSRIPKGFKLKDSGVVTADTYRKYPGLKARKAVQDNCIGVPKWAVYEDPDGTCDIHISYCSSNALESAIYFCFGNWCWAYPQACPDAPIKK
jgi:hypothetical protein